MRPNVHLRAMLLKLAVVSANAGAFRLSTWFLNVYRRWGWS